MSTKYSLACGQGFHLYREAFDGDNIYLEIEGTHFEAAYNRVMVPIPVHIWEVIRRFAGVNFDYADKTDADIRDEVERSVDARLKRYAEATEKGRWLEAFSGQIVFGPIDAFREEQVAKGIAHHAQIRAHQQQIRAAITELERLQQGAESADSPGREQT